ncbi:MAG: neocarzinostatin apoprotein domain-containing protein [Acidimicrobiales bacterium]
MLSTRTIRVVALAAVLSTGILTSGLVNAGGASATTTPKLVVTPFKGLTNHKTVTVSGTGFKPHDSVYITECQANAKGEAGCDIFTAVPAKISATGVLAKTKFKVVTGTIGNGKCGTNATNLRKCAVDVGNAAGKDSAVFKIVFK